MANINSLNSCQEGAASSTVPDPDRDGLSLDAERWSTTLSATWETEALCDAALTSINKYINGEENHGSDFVLKALLLRIKNLNSAVMASLGDTAVSTNELLEVIHPYASIGVQ